MWILAYNVYADDGSRLWLPDAPSLPDTASVFDIARAELSLLPEVFPVFATKDVCADVVKYVDAEEIQSLGEEEYIIRTHRSHIIFVAGSNRALLYAVYKVLRDYKTGTLPHKYNLREKPSYKYRILNHWDNLDGSVERGYAGRSIWWQGDTLRIPLFLQYARACASVGINGVVLNNVNATPAILSKKYIDKVTIIANTLRRYGIRVYLSVNFSSPMKLGRLTTADPLNDEVRKWWKSKTAEIYGQIPDFGGFLVKANSEGLPGPQDYGRTHADGANILADALAPYCGIVMWRAFVYSPKGDDRATQAYEEFVPLDGQFRENVIVQIKNGPIDFQPREPFSPLFAAMPYTAVMPELQITQEYLGFSNHLVFLAPLFEECLDSDTYCAGKGSTVAAITDGTLSGNPISAIAGVANIGLDRNWCGHHFAQANWYAFGRLAWCNTLTSEQIADEWLRMTFTHDDNFVTTIKEMMLQSRETCVEYMMPMGLHHLFAYGHHYGPEPWCSRSGSRPDWLPSYYHRADSVGIGFDRTTSGSNAVAQYCSPLSEIYNDIETCPDELLLWFHHVPWNYRMKNGETLWNNLCYAYNRGVDKVRRMIEVWNSVRHYVDNSRFTHVEKRLRTQLHDAIWWKDACLLYFQTFSGMPIPTGVESPIYTLQELKAIRLDILHHN